MKRFQRILVGIDLDLWGKTVSAGSRRAAMQAHWLARKTSANITFLHSEWVDAYEDVENETMRPGPSAEGGQALVDLVQEYDVDEAPVELVEVQDRPWIEIIRRVQRGENDLVIVGRRNAPGAHAFGSVAKKLLRKCPCPVWVVNPIAPLVHERVMAATDLTPVGDRAIELAASVARACECHLHVVHAWQLPMSLQMAAQRNPEGDHAERRAKIQGDAEEQISATLERVAPDVDAEVYVACDSPSRLVRRGVEELGIDLLVMGTLSREGVPGLLMGNTAERILGKVECSVLTIKPEGFVSPVGA